jgi:prophage regulatory protein
MSILRMPAVKAETGHRSHASIYTAIKAGTFTRPVPTGKCSVGWPDYPVKAIHQARIAGQTEAQIKPLLNGLHAKQTTVANGAKG